jgi:hypothetical protein
MRPWTVSGSVPNVGGHSAASSTPRRPLVDQPPAGSKCVHDDLDGLRDVGQLGRNGLDGLAVLVVDHPQGPFDRRGVEV